MQNENEAHTGLSPLSDGLWFIADAAFAVSRQEAMGVEGRQDLARRMSECAALPSDHAHHLRTRHLESKLPKVPGGAVGLLTGVYPADVNAWLSAVGAPYQWRPDDTVRLTLQQQRGVARTVGRRKPPPPERVLRSAGVPGAASAALSKRAADVPRSTVAQASNLKSIALVAREAAAEVMRRDVKDHGEEGSVRRALVDAWREAAERDFLARIGYHLSQGELIAVSVINGAPYNPRMGGAHPTDAMWLLSPEQEVKALELLGQGPPDTRPQFTTPARPSEVPPLLRILPADTEILVSANFGGSSGTGTARVGEYVEQLETIMRRQAGGVFTVSEAAQVLVDTRPGAQVRTMLSKMHQAYRDGKLIVRDPGDMLPKRIADTYRDYIDVVTVADVDAWLDAEGAGYRFPPALAVDEAKAQPRQPGNLLRLPTGTTHVDYDDLAHLIADALWPDQGAGDERWHYAGARVNLDEELAEAVKRGGLPVLDPLTLGPNRFPVGAALRRAKVAVEDLREWLRGTRRMDVVVGEAAARSGPSDPPQPIPPRVPFMERNKEAVLVALRNSGFEPTQLPPYAPGKAWHAKQEAKKGCGLSDAAFDHAWKALTAEGKIKQC